MRGLLIAAFLCTVSTWLAAADEQAATWQIQELQGQSHLSKIFFVNERIGWIQSGVNRLLKTSDGGKTWVPLETNLTERRTSIAGFWFKDEKRGWAAGTVSRQPTIWESSDGGLSWMVRYSEPPAFDVSTGAILDVRFVDELYGWAVGYNGFKAIIKATFDGGKHWITQYSGGEITGQFNLVRFWDTMHGWVLGPNAVMSTSDGGESWELQYFGGGSLLNDIDLVGPSEAWIAGGWGHLLHVQDRTSPAEVSLEASVGDSFIGWVRFVTKEAGWAWGVKGEIIKTADGGKTWRREASPLKIGPDSEMRTGDGAKNDSNLYITVNPGKLLVRPLR